MTVSTDRVISVLTSPVNTDIVLFTIFMFLQMAVQLPIKNQQPANMSI